MKKVRPISGFPEWLPGQKQIEDAYIARIRAVYESYGYIPIETPAAELVEVLAEQGVTDKEIYGLRRLKDEDDSESQIGLHFDLTIPFSRYVAQHLDKLRFPFRRYQAQKVWRGERPQKGRFREFYQFDADVVAREELPLCFDSEIVSMMNRAFKMLGLGKHQIAVNNRKCVRGVLAALGLSDDLSKEALISVDKLQKIGKDATAEELHKKGLSTAQTRALMTWCEKKLSAKEFLEVGVKRDADALEKEGIDELATLLKLLSPECLEHIVVDPSLVRGLDYYTGLIFEITLPDYPSYGSVAGGGRYENLVSRFSNQKLPGVGGSIGLTRLMDLVFSANLHGTVSLRAVPQLLVTVLDEEQRARCNGIAEIARHYGIPTEVYFKTLRLGKQIEYASDRDIPFVLFVPEGDGPVEIKDLRLKSQTPVDDFDDWCKRLAGSLK